jgi:catechol 2,3-dioxygenase-like lactoylglutathione lyase family enzyme
VAFALNRIGQIAFPVTDVERAEAFYRDALGLRHLYRYGDLTFFDCAGVRLLLEKSSDPNNASRGSPLYFVCHDIALAVAELTQRGVSFDGPPHLIARMPDHDLWMAFFSDPDGHTLALMQEAPKGYAPPPTAQTR